MGARATAEERFYPRYLPVSKAFSGQLKTGGKSLGGDVIDVSRDGLGALLNDHLKKGDTVELLLGDRSIQFQVMHCNEDLIHRGKFRCGMRRVGTAENLVSLFRAAGFVDRE